MQNKRPTTVKTSQKPAPSSFYILIHRVKVTLTSFSGRHVVTTTPALYKKIPPYRFEINKIMFRLNLDMFRGVFRLPGKKKKTKAYTKPTVVMRCQIFARDL